MLNIKGLTKSFYNSVVLSNIELSIEKGKILGLIGHSGSGKSTLARCLVGLEKPQSGQIYLNDKLIIPGQGEARQKIQYLWQDPMQALSPFLSAHGAIVESLNGFNIGSRGSRSARATKLLEDLGIGSDLAIRKPHTLSGGQAQRIALARALAAEPDLLILDEPLSSLDLPTQIATIDLLRKIHADRGISMLIISHDLAPLWQLANHIAVLDRKEIVENLPISEFAKKACHPLSRAYIQLSAFH